MIGENDGDKAKQCSTNGDESDTSALFMKSSSGDKVDQ